MIDLQKYKDNIECYKRDGKKNNIRKLIVNLEESKGRYRHKKTTKKRKHVKAKS